MQLVFLIVLPGLAATTAGRLKLDVDIPHAREDAEAAAERPEGQRASSDGDCEEPCQETSFLDAGAAVSRESQAAEPRLFFHHQKNLQFLEALASTLAAAKPTCQLDIPRILLALATTLTYV